MNCICKFCDKDLGKVEISSDDEAPLTQGHASSFECSHCNTRYVYSRSGKLYGYTFWNYYNGRKFAAHFFMKIYPDIRADIFGKFKDVAFKLTHDGIVEIFTLDFYPDITPNNFLKKLPTLLIFS